MYNSFIFEKTQRSQRLYESEVRHTSYEKKKHAGVRNKLAQKYNRRVQNFIYKMDESPLEIHEYKNQTQNIPQKCQHKSTKTDFKFVRAQWQQLQKSFNKNPQKDKEVNSHSMIMNIKDYKFRSRSKQKQIQIQPMRFNYIPKIVKRIRLRNEKNYEQQDNESEKKRTTLNNSSSQQDIFSITSRLSRRKLLLPDLGITTILTKTSNKEEDNKNNNQVSSEQDTKPVNKLYFNAVIELSQKQRRLSKTAKEILHKCKLVNYKSTSDESQRDLFSAYNKQ